ncbi:MAG: NUDIX hydrolase [Oscillospiraceae bacterium]|jgi:ADP-ribose pyrophosphatase|nr:NUDIX hydrolase [Oscillospiraceae bacterium]
MNLEEKTVLEQYIYKGRIINLRVDEITLPNGAPAKREVVEHHGGVCVAPLTAEGELIFVRQFRYPYKEVLLELPAGKLEKGEEPLAAGLRELKEETGAEALNVTDLGKLYPSPGYCGEVIHMYLSEVAAIGKTNPDEDEFLETVTIPLEKAVQMVIDGEIRDAKTQVMVLKIARLLNK